MPKIQVRSEYESARNQARKARRRGDALAAHHWLRLADRYLVVNDHFNEAVDNMMRREDARLREYEEIREHKAAKAAARLAQAKVREKRDEWRLTKT